MAGGVAMAMAERTSKPEETKQSFLFLAGSAVMICLLLLWFSIPGQFERSQARFDGWPLWLIVLVMVVSPWFAGRGFARLHKWFGLAFGLSVVPGNAATLLHRLIEPDPSWLGSLRAAGIASIIAVIFGFLVIVGRRFVELDRVLFTEATSVAFFATLFVAGGYAALEAYVKVPRLSYGWLPLAGITIWGVCALIFKRRLS